MAPLGRPGRGEMENRDEFGRERGVPDTSREPRDLRSAKHVSRAGRVRHADALLKKIERERGATSDIPEGEA